MLFCKGNIFSIRALCNCILLFSQSSRLQANSAKSVIYTAGIPTDIREEFRTISQFACGYLPFKYLTVPFSSKRLSMVDCEQIVDKMTWRIRAWSAKNLSYVAHLQLINSILMGISTYWCQMFILPWHVIKIVNSIYWFFYSFVCMIHKKLCILVRILFVSRKKLVVLVFEICKLGILRF